MFPIEIIKSKWYYAIILALALQLVILYSPKQVVIPKEAQDAIKRAKTDACKKELEAFVSRPALNDLYSIKFTRACPKDSNTETRIKLAGCISNSTQELVNISDPLLNSTTCLELCFSYGHFFGGFHQSTKQCYCGESELNSNKTSICNSDQLKWFHIRNGIFNAKMSRMSNNSNDFQTVPNIRIAFLLSLNGRSTIQVLRILKNIYSTNHTYYIHVDNRQQHLFEDLLPLESKFNNIILARKRLNTIWGGPSLLRMILDSISHLSRFNWDYLINLSETDFPIKTLNLLESYLAKRRGSIFLKAHNIKGYDFIKKQGLEWNFYQCEDRVWRLNKRNLPGGLVYSGGSDWFALPRDFALHIETHKNNLSSQVRPLLQIFNHTLLPAESFFHVIALNSEFCDRYVDNNLRITNWHRKEGCKCQHKDVVDWCGCSPLVYRLLDWVKLKQTSTNKSLFFSRKFDPTISASIISAVEQHLIHSSKYSINESISDTRYWLDIHPTFEKKQSLVNFGQLAFEKLINEYNYINNSTHIYFNHDKFIGITFSYCKPSSCLQFLIKKHPNAHDSSFNEECSKFSDKRLQVLEVNHGFDTNERLFRNYMPLDEQSDIVVYHEWLVQDSIRTTTNNSSERIKFTWISPSNSPQLIQDIKLKMTNRLTRLSLAHRMNMKKYLEPGVWILKVTINQVTCLSYPFMIFSNHLNDMTITSDKFSKFYMIEDVCSTGAFNARITKLSDHQTIQHCDTKEWTQSAKESFIRRFGLF